MDDGTPIALSVTIDRRTGSAVFDFEGTGAEVFANTNAPRAVTFSAVIYCLRCFVGRDIPLNQGCLAPITICIPEGSLLHPSCGAAVVGGNVLTSQRGDGRNPARFQRSCGGEPGCMDRPSHLATQLLATTRRFVAGQERDRRGTGAPAFTQA